MNKSQKKNTSNKKKNRNNKRRNAKFAENKIRCCVLVEYVLTVLRNKNFCHQKEPDK